MLCYTTLYYALPCYAVTNLCSIYCAIIMLYILRTAMLCYAILCYALCYTMLWYAELIYSLRYNNAMLCYAMLCYAMPCHAICYAMLLASVPGLPRYVRTRVFICGGGNNAVKTGRPGLNDHVMGMRLDPSLKPARRQATVKRQETGVPATLQWAT